MSKYKAGDLVRIDESLSGDTYPFRGVGRLTSRKGSVWEMKVHSLVDPEGDAVALETYTVYSEEIVGYSND